MDDGIEGDIFGFNMVLSSSAPKEKVIQKYVPRFNSRRRSSPPIDRFDRGYMVQSPSLIIRRRARKSDEGSGGEKWNDNIDEQTKNVTKTNSSSKTDEIDKTTAVNRQKRQFSFTPSSYSNFNFDFKPLTLKYFEPPYRLHKTPGQYAFLHQHVPEPFMSPPAPPRKTSRISNDIIPFSGPNQKPLGLQLVELSFNCALGKGAPLKNVLVSWTKTPVRVFGGAILKKGDPFCFQ